MFDLWERNKGLVFKADGNGAGEEPGTEPGQSAETNQDAADTKSGNEAKDKKPAKFEFNWTPEQQAEIGRIQGETRKEERKKAKAEAEAEIAKAKKEAEEKELADKQEFKTLAERRGTEIDTLKQEVARLTEANKQAETYKAALNAQLTEVKKTLPKFVLPLIEKMDPVEAMKYITDNKDELGVKPETYSQTPKAQTKKVKDEDVKSGLQASGTLVTRSF